MKHPGNQVINGDHAIDETPKGKASTKGSKTGKSASTKKPVKEPIAEVVMDDAGDDAACDDYQPQDTSEPKTRKTLNPEWFKQPPRPPTLDLECNKRQVVLDQLAQPWFNQMVSALKNPLTFNDLMVTLIDFSNIELKYNFQEWFNALTDKLDCNNLEGDRYPFDLSKHLPLQGPLGLKKVSFDDLTPEHHGDSASCLVCSTKLSTSTITAWLEELPEETIL
ncbi:hypothetical protein Tco_0862944 [Tanacetum coccineum]